MARRLNQDEMADFDAALTAETQPNLALLLSKIPNWPKPNAAHADVSEQLPRLDDIDFDFPNSPFI